MTKREETRILLQALHMYGRNRPEEDFSRQQYMQFVDKIVGVKDLQVKFRISKKDIVGARWDDDSAHLLIERGNNDNKSDTVQG